MAAVFHSFGLPHLAALGLMGLALAASLHAALHKRDSRAAALWVLFIWLSPALGPLLYWLFGINRIHRRASAIRSKRVRAAAHSRRRKATKPPRDPLPPDLPAHLRGLARATDKIAPFPLSGGNRIRPLVNGDEAYPRMLEAIARAERTISFSTYIFDNDPTGRQFARALGEACRRGVQVRVILDDAGARYSWPSILGQLRRLGAPTARFHPRPLFLRLAALNLRNHRKILVVDGCLGFTGGMNIRHGNRLALRPRRGIRDLMFEVQGPLVRQLQEVFAEDWLFCAGEVLEGPEWFPPLSPQGEAVGRGIPDGPDEDLDRLALTIHAAVSSVRERLAVATPYFLPERDLISALNTAALRGARVQILLPAANNLPFIHWASEAMWWQILKWGCEIRLSPPPFDHSKLLLADGFWTLIGSANLDPRSLRLNFEFNLECYDRSLAREMGRWFDARWRRARPVTLEEVDARPLPIRLRDGLARLAAPFL